MTGFIVGLAAICGAVTLAEYGFARLIRRLEKRASDDTSWSER